MGLGFGGRLRYGRQAPVCSLSQQPRQDATIHSLLLNAQEEDGVSPTAVREIMLLQETQHENIVRLDSVHINREVFYGTAGLGCAKCPA